MKNLRRLAYLPLTFTIILAFSGCGEDPKNISEGIIEYKAVPVDPNSSMANIAPSKMTVKFKNDASNAEMAAGFGMATMSFVSDPKKKEFISMVNLIGQKYASVMGIEEVRKYNYVLPEYDVVATNETKVIAGYKCKKAKIRFKDGSVPLEVYYTNEIKFKDPNWSNAFYKIDGVLMDYQLKKFGLELHFTATSVTESTIDDASFQLQPDYKKIPNDQLELMFKELE